MLKTPIFDISSIENEVDELLSIGKLKPKSNLSPCTAATLRRCQVQKFLTELIRSSCNFNQITVVGCGSTALRTYLPESDLDIVVFPPSDISAMDCLRKIFNNFCDEIARKDQRNALTNAVPVNSSDYEFVIRNMELVNARTKVLHCMVNNIGVDVTVRQLGSVTALAFLEEADKVLGNDHIFKRSLILIKSWCLHESRSYCGSSILSSKHGMFSSYALSILVLHLFNRFGDYLLHPLATLRCFLATYRYFPWETCIVTIEEAVPIATSGQRNENVDSGKVNKCDDESSAFSFKTATNRFKAIFSKFEGIQLKSTIASVHGANAAPNRFFYRPCNIQDPLDHMNNLGVAVTTHTLELIIRALNLGSDHMEYILAPYPFSLSAPQNQTFVAINSIPICAEEKESDEIKALVPPSISREITPHVVDQEIIGVASLDSGRKRSSSIYSREGGQVNSVDGHCSGEASRCSTVSPLIAPAQLSISPLSDDLTKDSIIVDIPTDNQAEKKSVDGISHHYKQPVSIAELPVTSTQVHTSTEKSAEFERYTMKAPEPDMDKHIPDSVEDTAAPALNSTVQGSAPLGTPLRVQNSNILASQRYGDEYAHPTLAGAQNQRNEDSHSKHNHNLIQPPITYSPHYNNAANDVNIPQSQSFVQYFVHSGSLAPHQQQQFAQLQNQNSQFAQLHPSQRHYSNYKQNPATQHGYVNPMHNGRVPNHNGKYMLPAQGQRTNIPQQFYYPSQPSPQAHQYSGPQKNVGYRKVPLRFPPVGPEVSSKKRDNTNFGAQSMLQHPHSNFQGPKNSDGISYHNKNSVGSNMRNERNRRPQQTPVESDERSNSNAQIQSPQPPTIPSKDLPRVSVLEYFLPNILRAYNLSHLPLYNKRCDLLDHPLQLQQQTVIFPNSSLSSARKYSFGSMGNESDSYNQGELNKQRRRNNSLDTLSSFEAQDDQSSHNTLGGQDDSEPQDLLQGDLEGIWKVIEFLTIEDVIVDDCKERRTLSENLSREEPDAVDVGNIVQLDSVIDQGSPPTDFNGVLQLKELLLAPDEVSESSPNSLLVASETSTTSDSRTGDALGVADAPHSETTSLPAEIKADKIVHEPRVDLANAQTHSVLVEPNIEDTVVRFGLRQKGKQSKRHRAHDTHCSNSSAKESIVKVPLLVDSSAEKELIPSDITTADVACTEQTTPWSAIAAYSRPLLLFVVTVISAFSIQRYWSSFLDSYSSHRSRTSLSTQQNSTWLQKTEGALFVLNLSLPSNAATASKTGGESFPSHGKAVTRSKRVIPGIETDNNNYNAQKLPSPHHPYDLVQWVVTGDTVTFGTDISRQGLMKGLPIMTENAFFLWTKDSKNVSVKAHDPAFPYLTLRRVGAQDAGRYRLFMCSGSQSFLLTETLLRISSKSNSPSITRA